ncbi:MAG: nicotinamide riboside transporter PnuC [Cryomorphaceae bacterium]|nr:nicotinamide riboside transporter PnuC [Flavobacteriales bacterium]
MSDWIEYAAVVFNVAYVILAARRNIWCWPAGIIGSALSIYLFIEVKIYAEAVLFAYYVVMGIYGWVVWSRETDPDNIEVTVKSMRYHLWIALGGYVGTGMVFWILNTYTDAEMPLLDSFTTVFAFIATWLVARRVLENWIYWIAVDSLAVYLYLARGLEAYALLSLMYTGMAVYGYVEWRRNYLGRPQNEHGNY